jgi:acyl carrier protein
MSTEEIRARVIRVVQTETGQDLNGIDPDADLRQQVNLDSMQYVAIAVAIENALGIELPIEVMKARTFNQFLSLVNAEAARNACAA